MRCSGLPAEPVHAIPESARQASGLIEIAHVVSNGCHGGFGVLELGAVAMAVGHERHDSHNEGHHRDRLDDLCIEGYVEFEDPGDYHTCTQGDGGPRPRAAYLAQGLIHHQGQKDDGKADGDWSEVPDGEAVGPLPPDQTDGKSEAQCG
jgi:hypothetical protein